MSSSTRKPRVANKPSLLWRTSNSDGYSVALFRNKDGRRLTLLVSKKNNEGYQTVTRFSIVLGEQVELLRVLREEVRKTVGV